MHETFETDDLAETTILGERLGTLLEPGSVVALIGEMGSGKTYFTKGIARGLGIDPAEVVSPTFTLLNVHRGRLPLCHLDFYRLERVEELEELGLEAWYDEGVIVIEWADRIPEALPADHLEVTISYLSPTHRRFDLQSHGPGGERILARLCAKRRP
ncbi:MAG: tRNA (adenosine(37)-N6)-threonylcarbamoyltransferase complex ATPase subunit type 1 TsaE [Deltaproteobacteria bacterium]|nr:MAG: tRNA (adenosine(37)-N6)-threonylcarbamoyltransferase complex ATPase subunit type 1 TsaE [Deltaproteobacteria bacterium]